MALGYLTGLVRLRAPEMFLRSGSLVPDVPQVSEQVLMLPHWQTRPTSVELLGPHPPHLPKYPQRCPSLQWVAYPGQELNPFFQLPLSHY